MRTPRFFACLLLPLLLCLALRAFSEDFAVFPDRKELHSPDGKYVIRSIERTPQPGEFVGVFRALVLEEAATHKTRVLCGYLGRAAVAWSGDTYIIVTDYVGKRTSRALVFSVDQNANGFVVDKNDLERRVSGSFSEKLRGNEHVFIEALKVQSGKLDLRVWGYGTHDPRGFRLFCNIELDLGNATCGEATERSNEPAGDHQRTVTQKN